MSFIRIRQKPLTLRSRRTQKNNLDLCIDS